MKFKIFLLMLAAILICSKSQADTNFAPNFDCKKANTSVDQLICHDNILSYLDSMMSKYYENAKKFLSPRQQQDLLDEQRAWLKKRAQLCQIPNKIDFSKSNWYDYRSCLIDDYKNRNYQLFLKGIRSNTQTPVAKITGKLNFAPFDVIGEISQAEIQQLYKTDIIIGGYKGIADTHTFNNCEDVNKYTAAPGNNMEVGMFHGMEKTCALLDILQKVQKPKISYIENINISDTQYLPLSFLPSLVDDDDILIHSYQDKHLSMDDLLNRGIVKIKSKSPISIDIDFNDNEMSIDEVARGDFLDKGIDSILVSMSTHSNIGTMWDSNLAILTREKNDQYFKIIWTGVSDGD